jgi:hypothetical protein
MSEPTTTMLPAVFLSSFLSFLMCGAGRPENKRTQAPEEQHERTESISGRFVLGYPHLFL